MARKIDYANLNEDDLQYLSDRQWLIVEGDYQGHETSKAVNAWRENGTVPDSETDDEDGETGVEYKDAKVADLRAELVERGLPADGKKEELIARLEADDLEHEEEEEEPEEDEELES